MARPSRERSAQDPVSNESAPNSGAVYVYDRVGTVWSFQHFIKASNTSTSDSFGISLSISADGSTLAVGASGEDGSGTGVGSISDEASNGSGAVYVYARSVATWTFQEYVKASNTSLSDDFGFSLALSTTGDTLAVGADQEDSSGVGIDSVPNEAASGSGAVYVYQRTAGAWAFQAFIKAINTEANDAFATVALSGNGDLLAVGATFESSSGARIGSTPNESSFNSGAVYLYLRRGTTWAVEAFVKAGNPGPEDRFGSSVTLSRNGRFLAVGAAQENSSGLLVDSIPDEGAPLSGAAYTYVE